MSYKFKMPMDKKSTLSKLQKNDKLKNIIRESVCRRFLNEEPSQGVFDSLMLFCRSV